MYENKEQSRGELVVACALSTVMDDVEKQLLIRITCAARRMDSVILPSEGKYGIPKGVGLGVLWVCGTKRSAYLPT